MFHLFISVLYEQKDITKSNCVFTKTLRLFTLLKVISENKFWNLQYWYNDLGMNSYFMSLKMNGPYCILWSCLLYAVCFIGMTNGCPARCYCNMETCKTVSCRGEGLKNVPTGIPNDTCTL